MKPLTLTIISYLAFTISGFSQSSNDFFKEGEKKFKQKEYEEAITDFNKAIGADSGNAQAYYYRANAYTKTGWNYEAL